MSSRSSIRVAVAGAMGRMGWTTCEAVAADTELFLSAAIDPAFAAAPSRCPAAACFATLAEALGEEVGSAGTFDVVVDFTTPSVVHENILAYLRHRIPSVIGTTGLTPGQLAEIGQMAEAQGVPVLIAPNFAMGAVLMMQFAKEAARQFRACEIVELHHDKKLDAPSGTSRLTRVGIEESWREMGYQKEIPIHSVRLPGLVAHQEVIFGSAGETLTIRHDSLARESFMPGVILAIKRVRSVQGLVVGLENIL